MGLFAGCADGRLTGPNPTVDNLGNNPGELLLNAAAFPGGIDQLLVSGDIESGTEWSWWKGPTTGYDLTNTTEHAVSGAHSMSSSSDHDRGHDNFTFWAQPVRLEVAVGNGMAEV